MTVINLTTLASGLGAPAATDAWVQCTPWSGSRPAVRVSGEQVIVSDTASVRVTLGVPQEALDLEANDSTWCWKILTYTTSPSARLTRYVNVPASGPVDFEDLVDVDPATFEPTDDNLAAWEAIAASQVETGEVDEDGHLILTARDGSTQDAGQVVGEQGAPGFPRGNRLVCMGDSISASSVDGPHGAMWPVSLCELSQQRILFGGNTAHGGESSAQTLARVPEALALEPGIITVTTGSNDVGAGVSFATYKSNIAAIHAAVQAAGVRSVLTTIQPVLTSPTVQAKAIEWNAWLRAYAAANDVDLLDFANLLTDPVTGGFKAGYDSGDGLHPSQAAHVAMAQYASDLLLPTVPAWTPDGAHTAGEDANTNTLDPTNLVKNPLLQHGAPTNWTWTSATGHVGTLVTDAAFKGKAWRIAVSGATAGQFSQFNSALVPVVAGTRYAVTARTRVDSSTLTPALFRGLRFELWPNAAAPIALVPGFSVVRNSALWHYEVTIPVGVTGVYLVALVSDVPSGQAITCHLGEFSLRQIITP